MAATFSYETWNALLPEVVTSDGKADYPRLAERREQLDAFVAQLGDMSPESHPDAFPHGRGSPRLLDQRVQRLHAARDHGRVSDHLGVEDARRAVLPAPPPHRRRPRRQPRRHRARDPARRVRRAAHPLRHQLRLQRLPAAAPVGLRGRAACATRCAPPPSSSSAASGTVASTTRRAASSSRASSRCTPRTSPARRARRQDYRRGVLRFVAQHTGLPLEQIADYEVVYNIYDWGLNDANRAAAPRADPLPRAGRALRRRRHRAARAAPLRRQLLQPHLLAGARSTARRTGGIRTTRPRCSIRRWRTVATDGNIKFYGGEPTLHAEAIIDAMAYLRARGFRGLFTIFSNGVKAERLIDILDSDARSEAVLNYSIYHGRDAEPLPPHAKQRLEDVGARQSEPHLPGLQGALPRRRRRRRGVRPRPRGRLPRPRQRLRALLPGAHQPGPLPRLPVRRRDRRAALRSRPRRHRSGDRLPQLPHLPRAGSTTCSTPPHAPAASAAARCATATCAELPVPTYELTADS